MMDESVGHMTEKVVIPPPEQIEVTPRRYTRLPPGEYRPYQPGPDGVPDITRAGAGHRIHITGLTHDERGYPVMSPDCQQQLVSRLVNKIRNNAEQMALYHEDGVDGADVVVISYGITSRVASLAVKEARNEGLKVGHLRLVVVWPLPERYLRELASRVAALVVPELNLGQVVLEVERCAAGKCKTVPVPHAGGTVHQPEVIRDAIARAAPASEARSQRRSELVGARRDAGTGSGP